MCMIERTGTRDYSLDLVTEPIDTESIGIDSLLTGRRRTRVGDVVNLARSRLIPTNLIKPTSNPFTNGDLLRAAVDAAYQANFDPETDTRVNILLPAGKYNIGDTPLVVGANTTITGISGDRESVVIITNPDMVTHFHGLRMVGQAALVNLRVEMSVNAFMIYYTATSTTYGELTNVHLVNVYDTGITSVVLVSFVRTSVSGQSTADKYPPVMRYVKCSFTGNFVSDTGCEVRFAYHSDFIGAVVAFGEVRDCTFKTGVAAIQADFHSCHIDSLLTALSPIIASQVSGQARASRFFSCVIGARSVSGLLSALVILDGDAFDTIFSHCSFDDNVSTAGRFDGDGTPIESYSTTL